MRLKIAKWRREIETNPCKMPGQERRETNYQPFFQSRMVEIEILFVSSNASPKGLKISILGLIPFMTRILKRFGRCNQACAIRSAKY